MSTLRENNETKFIKKKAMDPNLYHHYYEVNNQTDDSELEMEEETEDEWEQHATVGYSNFFAEGSMNNCRGSVHGRIDWQYKRDYKDGHERLMRDYFIDNPTYDITLFHCRYRMSPAIFSKIYIKLHQSNPYFTYRLNGA